MTCSSRDLELYNDGIIETLTNTALTRCSGSYFVFIYIYILPVFKMICCSVCLAPE